MTIKNINVENYTGIRMEEYEYLFKTCIFGDKDVGKKTLAKNINPRFNEKLSLIFTIGVDFFTKNINTFGIITKLQLWICSDEIRFKCNYPINLIGSLAIILMYDINNANSLNYLSEVLQSTKKVREKYNLPVLLVGNKSDLKENREVSEEQIKKFKMENNISRSMEISIKTGENVEKMFMKITRMTLKGFPTIEIKRPRRIERPKRIESPYIKIDTPYRRRETPLEFTKSSKRFISELGPFSLVLLIGTLMLMTIIGNVIKDLNNFYLSIGYVIILIIFIIVLVVFLLRKRKKS